MPKLHKLQHLNQKLRPIQQMLFQAFLEAQEVVVLKDSLVEPQKNQRLNYRQRQNLRQHQKILGQSRFWKQRERHALHTVLKVWRFLCITDKYACTCHL